VNAALILSCNEVTLSALFASARTCQTSGYIYDGDNGRSCSLVRKHAESGKEATKKQPHYLLAAGGTFFYLCFVILYPHTRRHITPTITTAKNVKNIQLYDSMFMYSIFTPCKSIPIGTNYSFILSDNREILMKFL
jgi:hypothetical protein